MSNRKKVRPTDQPDCAAVGEWFAAHDGLRVRGGCDTCDAEQELTTAAGNVYYIKIAHDDWCPTLRRIRIGGRS